MEKPLILPEGSPFRSRYNPPLVDLARTDIRHRYLDTEDTTV